VSTAWLVFKTFFASLLPEGPPAIANWQHLALAAWGFNGHGLDLDSSWISSPGCDTTQSHWKLMRMMISFCDQAKAQNKTWGRDRNWWTKTAQGFSCRYSEEL
jgi:hypothetical protein